MKTLYLQSYLSINGRGALKGRNLYDKLKNLSEECLLAHMISSSEKQLSNPKMANDVVDHSLFRDFDPTVIYVEGGLFASDDGTWKVPQSLVEKFVNEGGIFMFQMQMRMN